MREYYIYMLRCKDNTYYTGITNNYEKRFKEHQQGDDPHCYTFSRKPLRLVYVEIYQWVWDAIEREKQIKRWSRAKKEALIRGDMNELTRLSRNVNYHKYMSMKKKSPSTSSGRQKIQAQSNSDTLPIHRQFDEDEDEVDEHANPPIENFEEVEEDDGAAGDAEEDALAHRGADEGAGEEGLPGNERLRHCQEECDEGTQRNEEAQEEEGQGNSG
jgi:putative endonuclease